MQLEKAIRFLTLVKAYPTLSNKYGEVSCIAGVDIDARSRAERWIRLYPVPFRTLEQDQKFRKYEPIRLIAQPHSGDVRPETRRPDVTSIEKDGRVLPTTDGWRERRAIVEPLIEGSMCGLQRDRRRRGTSLGMFRPREVRDLRIEELDVKAEKKAAAEAWANQPDLFHSIQDRRNSLKAIEQIPYRFKYVYSCRDPNCSGRHEQSIIDWELMQLYRRVRKRHDWKERVRSKYLEELCGPSKDTAFIVGNLRRYPGSFLILSVWWPPKRGEQLQLGAATD